MKKKSIVALSVSALTGTSLLLALVFSPLRGYYSDDTTLLDKTQAISGVNFNGKIKNARNSRSYQVLSGNSFDISGNLISTKGSSRRNGSGGTASVNSESTPGIYFVNNAAIKGARGFGNENNSSGNKASNVSGNAIGLITSTSLSNQKKQNSVSSKPGFISTTADLTLAQKSGTKLNAGSGPPPDSGNGDNPTPTPNLPVGDGVPFMLMLAVAFGSWKIKNSFN